MKTNFDAGERVCVGDSQPAEPTATGRRGRVVEQKPDAHLTHGGRVVLVAELEQVLH